MGKFDNISDEELIARLQAGETSIEAAPQTINTAIAPNTGDFL